MRRTKREVIELMNAPLKLSSIKLLNNLKKAITYELTIGGVVNSKSWVDQEGILLSVEEARYLYVTLLKSEFKG